LVRPRAVTRHESQGTLEAHWNKSAVFSVRVTTWPRMPQIKVRAH
jgi:hypothetical protein